MDDVIIKDNFLPPAYFQQIQELMLAPTFDWRYLDDLTFYTPNQATKTFGYYHWFVNDGSYYSDAMLLQEFYERNLAIRSDLNSVVKSRGAMITNVGETKLHVPHVDAPFTDKLAPHFASILYINETDGDTILFKEETDSNERIPDRLTIMQTITPKPNRLLMFKGSYIHTGCSPTKVNRRVWINSNFE